MPRKKPTKKRMSKRLDDACRRYIKLRDNYTCTLCGITQAELPENDPWMAWSHTVSRAYFSVRWNQMNSLTSCPPCHRQWGAGLVMKQVTVVDQMWGAGTVQSMENIARKYPSIKGTNLDTVDFRLSLEKYYKKLSHALESGAASPAECMATAWTESAWGMPLTKNKGEIK